MLTEKPQPIDKKASTSTTSCTPLNTHEQRYLRIKDQLDTTFGEHIPFFRRVSAGIRAGWNITQLRMEKVDLKRVHTKKVEPIRSGQIVTIGRGLNPEIFSKEYIQFVQDQDMRDFLQIMKGPR